MAVLVVFLLVLPVGLGSNQSAENPTGRSRAKVVEDYLLSADFNSLLFPQVRSTSGPSRGNHLRRAVATKAEYPGWISRDDFGQEFGAENPQAGIYHGDQMMERDLVVHGHHPPPPPAVISPYSLFAIGFIGFLTLLGTLQASLAVMTTHKHGGALGGLVKPSGRRRRSATFRPSAVR